MVYIKVKPLELLVSCSIGTDGNYLSCYAYFALCDLLEPSNEFDLQLINQGADGIVLDSRGESLSR